MSTTRLCVIGLLFVASVVPAAAQGDDPDLARIRGALLEKVRVTDATGAQRTAILFAMNGDELTLLTGSGQETLKASDLQRIEKKGDSLKNGAAIGAGFGLAIGLMAGQGYDHLGAAWVIGTIAASGFYALVGAGLDALHVGWTTVAQPMKKEKGRSEKGKVKT